MGAPAAAGSRDRAGTATRRPDDPCQAVLCAGAEGSDGPRRVGILPATMKRVGLRELSPRRVQGAIERRRHRWQRVSQLPKGGGVGAEIGTWEGDFSAQLLKRLKPQRLYLIDPWEHRTEATYERAFFGDRTPGGQAKMDAIHQGVERRFSAPITAGQVVILRM